MPLREDLLEPTAGDNPAGANLYYDKIFDQIKEARTEDTDIGPSGAWERTQKKADHALVIKLAGEALAKRSKDLRLAGWLIESHLKREGITLLVPALDLLWKLQETFWATFYPEIEEDGNLDLRVSAVEGVVNRLAVLLRHAPVTRAGLSASQYTESRRVGYEEAADTSDKQAARQDAIDQGQTTPEDFDASFKATPKAFYVATEKALEDGLAMLGDLGAFHEEKYGDDYPSLSRLATSIEEVKQVVTSLLQERRKTEPDPVEESAVAEAEGEPEEVEPEPGAAEIVEVAAPVASTPRKTPTAKAFSGTPTSAEQAMAAVQASIEYLRGANALSPVPYLMAAGMRLGETRLEGASPAADFAVAPATETRQALRRLAGEAAWDDLMKLCLTTLAEPCARAWLDLHRYTWRAANELGASATAGAVVATVRGLLQDLPELRGWSLDDDTPAANAETQLWIDAEVLQPGPVPEPVQAQEPVSYAPVTPMASTSNGNHIDAAGGHEIYEQATDLLRRGRVGEALTVLTRDAEVQPSGRDRFQRRVQVAQLCLQAEQCAIAYPVLMELASEIERRGLDSWESAEMLAHPLGLLLRCLDQRSDSDSEDQRVALFERLCRLDPQAALATQR